MPPTPCAPPPRTALALKTSPQVAGGVQWEVMTLAAVLSVRDKSEGYRAFKEGKIRSNPWDTHFEEMGKKTVIRRLFKYLPVSVEIQHAVSLDEMADAGINQQNGALIDGEFLELDEDEPTNSKPPETRTEALKEKLREAEPAGAPPAENGNGGNGSQVTAPDLIRDIANAETAERLDEIRSIAAEHLTGQAKANVTKAANSRYEELRAAGKLD